MSVLWTSPAWSWPLLLVVAAGAIFLTVRFYGQSRPHPGMGLRRTLVILRSVALFMLVLAIAGPIFSRIFRDEAPGQLVFLLEDSASMNLEAGSSGSSRWLHALAAAAEVDSALAAMDLAVDTRFLRGNGLNDLLEFQLTDAVIPDPQNHGTNLSGLLEKANNRLAADPVRAMVVLTDGQETIVQEKGSGSFLVLSAAELIIGGVGDARGSSDRLIKDLRYPETAFQGDKLTVEATILQRQTNFTENQPLAAYLKQDDRIVAQKTIEAGPGATNVELSFVPGETGLQMFELEISPLGNERFLTNNRVSLGIDVHKARARLLVLAERPGWNIRFLAQAARLENRLAMEVVYATEKGLVYADSLQLFEEPRTVAQWLKFDGVILSGWSGFNGRMDHALLGQAVDAGLGLMILPGLQESDNGRLRQPAAGIQELLPVVLDQMKWDRGPLFAHLDSLAYDHPVFSGLNLAVGSNPLSETPPVAAVVPCRPRDGSQTLFLALHLENDLSTAVPLLVLSSRQAGRLAFWSGSRLWEMAFWEKAPSGPETPAQHTVRRAMRNLLVWLADGSQESGLSFSGRRTFYQEGENIRLAAQWRDMRGQPIADGRLSLEVRKLQSSGNVVDTRSFPISGYDTLRDEYEFLLRAMPPGRYSVQLLGHGEAVVEGSVEELVITSHSVEQTQVRQDGRRLRQLAQRLGGTYHNFHEASENQKIIEQLSNVDWKSSQVQNLRKWDPASGWPFLVTVILLLACEWFLRRRHGLL